jgi:hypothetical protein
MAAMRTEQERAAADEPRLTETAAQRDAYPNCELAAQVRKLGRYERMGSCKFVDF